MKKNYKQPNTIIVKVNLQSMIATSPLGLGGTTSDPNALLSRDRDAGWDDEDDW